VTAGGLPTTASVPGIDDRQATHRRFDKLDEYLATRESAIEA